VTFVLQRARRRRLSLAVALIGPDGAGKSSVARRVSETLPVRSRTIYMGVNMEASTLMLPTTRLMLQAKQARGGEPDRRVSTRDAPAARRSLGKRIAHSTKSAVRMANWVAEEWFRQAAAESARRRGEVVIFDRHFFCDFYAYDIDPQHGPRPLSARVHGFLLARTYPRPDLVVYLDAPAEVLYRRKGEGSLEFLEELRGDYLRLGKVFGQRFVVVDAARAPEVVASDVVDAIVRHLPGSAVDRRADNPPRDAESRANDPAAAVHPSGTPTPSPAGHATERTRVPVQTNAEEVK
jgi:thymidylate kinase